MLILFSCKSKKQASSEKTRETIERKIETNNQIRFDGMYVDACAARMKGNLEEASKLFSECKRISPDNNAVQYELATIYKLLGVNDQALLYAKSAAQAEPKNEWYQLLLIDCYNILKQYNLSVKVRETLVKNFPNKSDFKEDLAIEYAILGLFDKAFKIYEELEKIYGINEQITLNKTKLLKSLRKFETAEDELLRLSSTNVTETRYYSYLADFYIEQNEMAKAKAMYDKIISIEPNNPIVNLALHDYYSGLGKTAEAFECLKKAFQNPDLDAATKCTIANSFYDRIDGKEGSYYRENGAVLAKTLVHIHSESADANAIYAKFLMLEKRVPEAAEYYYKSAFKEKGNFNVWNELLIAYNILGRNDSVEHISAIAMELFPNSAGLYFRNGYANIQLKNYKKAAQSLKDGLEFVDSKLLMMDFYDNMGDAYFQIKEYEKSDRAFDDALKIDSDHTFTLNQYAYYLSLRKQNLDRAEKLAKHANDLSPDNRKYMDTYGYILFQQKKYKEAETWLAGAIKFGPKDRTILEHYGDVLFKLNKTNEALKYWEEAKAAGGSSDELIKKIKDKKLND